MIDYLSWLELQTHYLFYCTFICFSFWKCMHFPYICSFSYIVWENAVHLIGAWSIACFSSCFHKYDYKCLLTLHLNKNCEQISQCCTKWAKLIWRVVVDSDRNDTCMFDFSSSWNTRSKEAEGGKQKWTWKPLFCPFYAIIRPSEV